MNKLQLGALWLLAAVLLLGATCGPRETTPENKPPEDKPPENKLTWGDVPEDVFDLDDAAAFTVSGQGRVPGFEIRLDDSPLGLTDAAGVRLFQVGAQGLQEVSFEAAQSSIRANLTAGATYVVFRPATPAIGNAYDVLCRLRQVRERVRGIDPGLVDRICLVILCPAERFPAVELRDRFEVLEQFPEFAEDELRGLELSPLGAAGTANLCDRCTRFGRPDPPHVIDCVETGPIDRGPDVKVINVVPRANSGETNQDSEPNLAVDPADPTRLAASAFTPNPAGVGNAPIFVSTDGGESWRLNPIVRSSVQTSDITLRFTRTTQTLYTGILRRPGGLRLNVQSAADFTAPALMTVEVDRGDVDQPYVQATDVDGEDRVYVGDNDFATAPRTATVDQTVDGAATWTSARLEARATSGQDLPPIRPAIGPGEVIYATFFGRRAGGSDVVVVRDDNGATGPNPYRDLTGSDGQGGVRVVTGRDVPFENFSHADFGQERLVASDLSIAVDPNDAARLCVAWGDRVGDGDVLTLHLRCSTDSGETWSEEDVRTIRNAKSPALALSGNGKLGFLYQAVEEAAGGDRWVTHFERYRPNLSRIDDVVLATVPANAPAWTFLPYVGDYVHLMALGTTFYGIFSANNTPDRANFPQGVRYQREADFTARVLRDLDGGEVEVSIDPFFFRVRE